MQYVAQGIPQIDAETCLPLAGCEKGTFLDGHELTEEVVSCQKRSDFMSAIAV